MRCGINCLQWLDADNAQRFAAFVVNSEPLREIAEKKMTDLNAKDLEGACNMIVGSARSMGLEVVE